MSHFVRLLKHYQYSQNINKNFLDLNLAPKYMITVNKHAIILLTNDY